MRQVGGVNNYPNFKKSIILFSYINHIDRIQFSVKHPDLYYQKVRSVFNNEFIIHKPDKVKKKRIVTRYIYGGKIIQLIYHTRQPPHRQSYYFSINIHDPDNGMQSLIRDMLYSIVGNIYNSIIYISQVEFAWDLYPKYQNDFIMLWNSVTKSIYLRNSRLGSFKQINTTHYEGKGGNVRKGTKGLRCYPKKRGSESFLRVELQLNRDSIKKNLNLDLSSLPIDPSIVKFSDYIEFRTGYDLRGINNLSRKLDVMDQKRKGLNRRTTNRRSLAHIVRQELIARRLSGEDLRMKFNFFDPPAAQQISGFRQVQKKLGFSSSLMGIYFPKIPVLRMRTEGAKLGYVRVPDELLEFYNS